MAAAAACPAPPAAFCCPISLELMTDPVTTSSGITYDRASIQSWLAAGNRTCPLTRQPLLPLQLVPNHTLLRIIDSWCLSQSPSPSPSPLHTLISPLCTHALLSLGRLPQPPASSSSSGALTLPHAEAAPLLISLLAHFDRPPHPPHCAFQDALSSLSSLPLSPRHLSSLSRPRPLRCLVHFLHTGDPSCSHSSFLLAALISRHASPREFLRSLPPQTLTSIAEGLALCLKLYSPPADKTQSILVSLSLLCNCARIADFSDTTRTVMAHSALDHVLHSARTGSSDNGSPISESALSVLEALAKCAEGRAAITGHTFAVPAMAKLLHPNVSEAVVESVVVVLWKLCRYSGVERVRRQAVAACVPGKLAIVLQFSRTYNSRTKLKAAALMRLLLGESANYRMVRS